VSAQEAEFSIGEAVRIKSGAFASFKGKIEEIDKTNSLLKVRVTIFGRPSLVDVEEAEVEKIGSADDWFTSLN
jgi:transcriptional antiterminator NusG